MRKDTPLRAKGAVGLYFIHTFLNSTTPVRGQAASTPPLAPPGLVTVIIRSASCKGRRGGGVKAWPGSLGARDQV